MIIEYRKSLIGLAVLFYIVGAYYFSLGFHFSELRDLWRSELGEKISFLIMLACIIEAIRNLLIYLLRPSRLRISGDSVTIIGLFGNRTVNFSDVSKVNLCFAEDNDVLGLKRKVSIEMISGGSMDIGVFALEFDAEKFVNVLKNAGIDVCING